MPIVIVGVALANNVFAMRGMNEVAPVGLVRPEVPRNGLLERVVGM